MRAWLERQLMKRYFNAITQDDVLVYRRGKFFIGGNELPVADTQDIVSGASALGNMIVWKLLLTDMRYTANKIIHEKGETPDAIRFGRAMLYCIDVLEKKVTNLSNIK